MNKKLLKTYLCFIAGILVSYSAFFVIDNIKKDKQVDNKVQESTEKVFDNKSNSNLKFKISEENILLNRETPPNPEVESY
ncbi:MAG: hypothetical protein ACD_20C00214G0021 [uncultured bacterium]|nr:MAG: hypothetical protein ACD_20C00214G0021 [uncultured bacterium]HBH19164.1 hypothetical protein [Cyanobacteria bacterium UBA9579]